MRKIVATVSLALVAASLAACSGGGGKTASTPQPLVKLTQCPALTPLARPSLARTTPVTLPEGTVKGLSGIIKSSPTMLGVATLGGATHCVDVRLMSSVDRVELLQGGRFVSFDWKGYQNLGYPADGHVLIDRTGAGQHVDTGGMPVFSPSGLLAASAYQSETAFAQVDGLAIWQVTPAGLVRVTSVDKLPDMRDWRVDGWGGESCINLSATPFSRKGATPGRTRYTAKKLGNGWDVTEAFGSGCRPGS